MVLKPFEKRMALAAALLINTALLFGQNDYLPDYIISGLIQYGENIDRERLELLEDRQVIRFSGNLQSGQGYFITGNYIIRNSGREYRATLGLLFDRMQSGIPSPGLTDLQFFVDGHEISYTETGGVLGGIAVGKTAIDIPRVSTAWALIDVVFPAYSTVTIRVQYYNRFYSDGMGDPAFLIYNTSGWFEDYFPNLFYWKGHTVFSVEVTNMYIYENNVEYRWISGIGIMHKDDYPAYLSIVQQLETQWFAITKLSGNSFRVDFTEEFMRNYRREFFITTKLLQEEAGDGYFEFEYPGREITLNLLGGNVNISRRELALYELIFLTNNQLRIVRSAFYAQYGYVFQSEDLQNIFAEKLKDRSFPDFHESMLTDIDRANIETIRKLEALAGD